MDWHCFCQQSSDLASFQTGVDTIYSGCVTYGSTPTAKTPAAIVNAIKTIYNNRYNAGVTAGKSAYKAESQIVNASPAAHDGVTISVPFSGTVLGVTKVEVAWQTADFMCPWNDTPAQVTAVSGSTVSVYVRHDGDYPGEYYRVRVTANIMT